MAEEKEEEVSYNSLTGLKKAAVFLLSIGEDHTARLFAMMDDAEIKEVSQAMASLGMVNASTVEKIFVEFVEQISGTGSLMGSFDSTERLLAKVLDGERVGDIMDEIRGPAGRTMWDKLGNVNEEVLGNYLRNEYPQTVAVVLTKIKADHAGRVLASLPENLSSEVIIRMLRMENVQKEVLNDVERTLRTEFMSNLARTSKRDPHEMMADIFNSLDRETEGRFMSALEEREKDSAEKIRALMFTFEDLSRLDSAGVQTLLRSFDKSKLPIALKGCTDELRELFFGNMSERAAKILQEDMENMGPVRLKEVEEAQYEAVQLAKDLSEKGEIVIPDGEDEKLIY